MIIGVVGFIGHGKGTFGDVAVSEFGFVQESFAKSLKDACAAIFGWPRGLLEGDTEGSRTFRDTVDNFWSIALDIEGFTPRMALQQVGTEVFRNNFHDNIWVLSLQRRILGSGKNVVLTDVRYPNEIDAIRSLGGIIIRVKRGEDPSWFEDAKHHLHYYGNSAWQDFVEGVHFSEWAWANSDFDEVLTNDGTKEEFVEKVRGLIKGVSDVV